jgi:anti-anti-sigma regulatory factor
MGADTPEILVAVGDAGLYVAVGGRATQRTCPTVDRLVEEYLSAGGGGARIRLDVRGCEWIDSTFAGWLVRLSRRALRSGGGLTLLGCSDRCRTSLDRMQIAGLLRFSDDPPPDGAQRVPCPTTDKPSRAELELMLAAHEELAGVSDANRRIFEPIAEALRAQLARQ